MKKIFVIFFILHFASSLFSQQADSSGFTPQYRHGVKYVFKTSSGTIFKGFVVNETADFVTLENRDVQETYELRRSEIVFARLNSDRESYDEVTLGENYHARNYLFAQSALLFNQGQLSSTTHILLLDNLDYALSENWAVSATTLAFFYPITLGVKCAYQVSEGTYVGGNLFGIGLSNYNSSGLFGYGVMGKFTKGNSNENFTAFAGIIGLNSDLLFGTSAAFVNTGFCGAAYCRRFTKRIALNAEGWYLPEAGIGLVGAGVKLVGDEISCWTLGCFSAVTHYNNTVQVNLKSWPIPYLGFSRNFR